MHELLIAISKLVKHQKIVIYIDEQDNYVFKLITSFGIEAKPFWVVSPHSMEKIKYHFEKGNIDKELATIIDNLFDNMDEAIINHEPEQR